MNLLPQWRAPPLHPLQNGHETTSHGKPRLRDPRHNALTMRHQAAVFFNRKARDRIRPLIMSPARR
jgi:hypothetical protein